MSDQKYLVMDLNKASDCHGGLEVTSTLTPHLMGSAYVKVFKLRRLSPSELADTIVREEGLRLEANRKKDDEALRVLQRRAQDIHRAERALRERQALDRLERPVDRLMDAVPGLEEEEPAGRGDEPADLDGPAMAPPLADDDPF